MRFRDLFLIASAIIASVYSGIYGKRGLETMLFRSDEINRDDATRESTTLLSKHDWAEFQVVPRADSFRLLTNAALETMDAPDYDLSNPRLGWRYAIEYELLDAHRNLIERSEYHFRSSMRQLVDTETGEEIYPLFFGKSSLVATQTRTMQIAVNRADGRQVSILRARLLVADEQIREVVGRALARIERPDFDQRKTWNRMSPNRRESVSRYCVYDHELLTTSERNSLLRWRWTRCPTLGEFEQRFLFFIGDENDLEVRDEQLPMGFYTDPRTLATIPIPEGRGRLRIEFTPLPSTTASTHVSIQRYGVSVDDRSRSHLTLDSTVDQHSGSTFPDAVKHFEMIVEGGLVELSASDRLVIRAFWQPVDELAKQSFREMELAEGRRAELSDRDELEVTPHPVGVRSFVVSDRGIDYLISHIGDEPTPFRLQLRYPLGVPFANQISQSDEPPRAGLNWSFVDDHERVIDSGTLQWTPSISAYDWLSSNGMREMISDPTNFYFRVPPAVEKIRLVCKDQHLLANGYVRPDQSQRRFRVPEDQHAFNRLNGTNRTWFGLYPNDHAELIRSNQSFVVATQVRPPEADEQILAGDYQWKRYLPEGDWIGRQILVPQSTEDDLGIRDEAINATYFELPNRKTVDFQPHEVTDGRSLDTPRLIFASPNSPGKTIVLFNGHPIKTLDLRSQRGTIDLRNAEIAESGTLEIRSERPARYFANWRRFDAAGCFLKRTAQRLDQGRLEFLYRKTSHEDEILTFRFYAPAATTASRNEPVLSNGDSVSGIPTLMASVWRMTISSRTSDPVDQRLQVDVSIDPVDTSVSISQPQTSWTIRKRRYDLRKMAEAASVMLGSSEQLDNGHRCFLKLGQELPPGDYRISVQCLGKNKNALVLVYQTIPGFQPTRTVKIRLRRESQP